MVEYLLLVAGIALAAFHSGSETGFYCVNRLRLRLWSEKGNTAARSLQQLVARPQLTVSAMLLGTNIGVYLATVMFTARLRETVLAPRADLYSSLLMPPILLLFAEVAPKSLFQHHAEWLMYRVVWLLRASTIVFRPFALALQWISGLPYALSGRKKRPRGPLVTPDVFRFYLSEGAAQGVLSPFQRTMAENILQLKTMDVATAMTPISKVIGADERGSIDDLKGLFKGHRYSRIPVWRGDRRNIVGVINVIDVASARHEAVSAKDLIREVVPLQSGTSVADALRILRQNKQQFAVVTDADGRALGIVTLKDLVEEIVGELAAW